MITPYCREPAAQLAACHESVKGQSVPCTHVMVADGHPRQEVGDWAVEQIILPRAHGDWGNQARGIGALFAVRRGFDAIAFLDADNWYEPGHLASMVEVHLLTGALVCTSGRTLHRPDGSLMYADVTDSDGKHHVDTNCFFLTRGAFGLLPIWSRMPAELGPIGDRILWQAIVARDLRRAHRSRPTVAYRTLYRCHYDGIGEAAPAGAKLSEDCTHKAMRWWASQPDEVRAGVLGTAGGSNSRDGRAGAVLGSPCLHRF